MNVNIPKAVLPLSPALSEFFDGMVHKLNVNSHKDKINDRSVIGLIDYLMEELQEFKDQIELDKDDPNTLSELFDMGNFCFLLYSYMRGKGVMDLKERFIKDFYSVDVYNGKIYCKKTRSGSPLQVGDEVRGQYRKNGVCYIRAQHTASGASIYLPRRDVIWWTVTGKWPERPLKYFIHPKNLKDGVSPDFYKNLFMPVDNDGPKYPYVSKYAPKGREGTENWGKYVYQRRHKYKLVRCGYYETEEEAAVEGLKAWKEKTRVA